MLILSMSVSVDGFVCDRDGLFGWSVPDVVGGGTPLLPPVTDQVELELLASCP